MKQLRTLCRWIPGLEANYKAGAFLASGFNAEKPGFVNLDEFLPVSLPPLDPDPFTSPLPGYLPKEDNIDQELLQFTVGLVNLYINTIPFTGVENVNAYLKDVTLTILMNRTAFLYGFRDMLNQINDVLHKYDNRYLLDLPKPSSDSDSLWHGLEPTEQRIDSLGVGGIKRVRLPSVNDGLILFGNSQDQPVSIDVHGDDHFNHLIFKYTPEYLDAKIEVHYGTKSMAQLVAAMFLR